MIPSLRPAIFLRLRRWQTALSAAACLGLTGLSAPAVAAAAGPDIVLVHGAFTDGSVWGPVVTRLQARGYRVVAVQLPLTSLDDDVTATTRVLRRQGRDVLLVGHSWGGVVITQAGNDPAVRGLVYLSALAPDSGASAAALLQGLNAPPAPLTADSDGFLWLADADRYRQVMAADLPVTVVRRLTATQKPLAASAFTEPVRDAAWRHRPAWYLLTMQDQALPPAVQQAIAGRIGAAVTPVRSSHLSLLSHPDAVVRLIDRAARSLSSQ